MIDVESCRRCRDLYQADDLWAAHLAEVAGRRGSLAGDQSHRKA